MSSRGSPSRLSSLRPDEFERILDFLPDLVHLANLYTSGDTSLQLLVCGCIRNVTLPARAVRVLRMITEGERFANKKYSASITLKNLRYPSRSPSQSNIAEGNRLDESMYISSNGSITGSPFSRICRLYYDVGIDDVLEELLTALLRGYAADHLEVLSVDMTRPNVFKRLKFNGDGFCAFKRLKGLRLCAPDSTLSGCTIRASHLPASLCWLDVCSFPVCWTGSNEHLTNLKSVRLCGKTSFSALVLEDLLPSAADQRRVCYMPPSITDLSLTSMDIYGCLYSSGSAKWVCALDACLTRLERFSICLPVGSVEDEINLDFEQLANAAFAGEREWFSSTSEHVVPSTTMDGNADTPEEYHEKSIKASYEKMVLSFSNELSIPVESIVVGMVQQNPMKNAVLRIDAPRLNIDATIAEHFSLPYRTAGKQSSVQPASQPLYL